MKPLILFSLLVTTLFACRDNLKNGKQIQPVSTDTSSSPTTVDDGIKALQQAIAKNPDSVRLYDRLIDSLAIRKRFTEAAAWCNKLLGRGADSNYYYWFIKGDIFRRGQLYDSALRSYQTYLSKFPDDEQVLLNLANTYAEAGSANAVDLANKIAVRFPTREMRSEAAFIRGVYFNQIKKYAEARRWLDTCIIINYLFSEAYMEKGYSFFDEGKYAEALKTFSTLANLNGKQADAFYWMARCQENLGKTQDAIKNYEQAFELDSTITEAETAIGRLRSRPG